MTTTSVVKTTVRAQPAALFDMFASPDALERVAGVGVEIVRPAPDPPSTVGLQRRVNLPIGYLLEEITETEDGSRFGYHLLDAPLPFSHEFGEIRIRAAGADRTNVEWETRYSIPAGPLARPIELIAAGLLQVIFRAALWHLARTTRRPGAPVVPGAQTTTP